MTSQTDKNIAMAKECGATVNHYGTGHGTVTMFIREFDEYTSRVCAESWHAYYGSAMSNAALQRATEEKDALIAMQAEALQAMIDEARARGCGLKIADDALAATAETVEAWKNKQGDKK